MDATAPAPHTAPPGPSTSSTTSALGATTLLELPAPVVHALTDKARDDPDLRALVGRIRDGAASHADNFRFLSIVNQIARDLLERGQRQQQADMRRAGRRPRTRCRN